MGFCFGFRAELRSVHIPTRQTERQRDPRVTILRRLFAGVALSLLPSLSLFPGGSPGPRLFPPTAICRRFRGRETVKPLDVRCGAAVQTGRDGRATMMMDGSWMDGCTFRRPIQFPEFNFAPESCCCCSANATAM